MELNKLSRGLQISDGCFVQSNQFHNTCTYIKVGPGRPAGTAWIWRGDLLCSDHEGKNQGLSLNAKRD